MSAPNTRSNQASLASALSSSAWAKRVNSFPGRTSLSPILTLMYRCSEWLTSSRTSYWNPHCTAVDVANVTSIQLAAYGVSFLGRYCGSLSTISSLFAANSSRRASLVNGVRPPRYVFCVKIPSYHYIESRGLQKLSSTACRVGSIDLWGGPSPLLSPSARAPDRREKGHVVLSRARPWRRGPLRPGGAAPRRPLSSRPRFLAEGRGIAHAAGRTERCGRPFFDDSLHRAARNRQGARTRTDRARHAGQDISNCWSFSHRDPSLHRL
ncbi:hypothetical protein MRX96_020735 [Rhipicephalus microplus]